MLAVLTVMLVAGGMIGCGESAPEFDNLEHGDINYWHDAKFEPDTTDPKGERGRWTGWFHQDVVDASRLADGIIRAKIEGRWEDLEIVELPDDFLEWNYKSRLKQLAEFREMFRTREMKAPTLSGPHDGIVASHGTKRKDSYFSVNNAVKGIGWLPRADKLEEISELLEQTWEEPVERKLAILESLYQRGVELFDRTKQTSLELYARPNFETHTFLNQMVDPGVALVFLDLPESYELRCVVQMLHPDDPKLTDDERKAVDYINMVHDYFHGRMPWKSIGVLYHVVQVFDNSPPKGRGRRIVPALP
jgi:hypothetical protein